MLGENIERTLVVERMSWEGVFAYRPRDCRKLPGSALGKERHQMDARQAVTELPLACRARSAVRWQQKPEQMEDSTREKQKTQG